MSVHRHEAPKLINYLQLFVGGGIVLAPFGFHPDKTSQEVFAQSLFPVIAMIAIGTYVAVDALRKILPVRDPFHLD